MKIIKFELTVGTRYVGSTVKDEIELEFDDDATQEEIDKEIEEAWIQFRAEECDGGWKVLSEKQVNDDGE
ncbi:hypothetical protein [uncultured Acinetobacter sp.]|jgi:hypothetical protein|uniref:DUF7167 family protein n=1 Tax=uncultured Acinetobacter sp. TaxID=165433 RepID=UPI00261BBAEE|nr:hypothetical protein [uncultured Acinetobacter sp.]